MLYGEVSCPWECCLHTDLGTQQPVQPVAAAEDQYILEKSCNGKMEPKTQCESNSSCAEAAEVKSWRAGQGRGGGTQSRKESGGNSACSQQDVCAPCPIRSTSMAANPGWCICSHPDGTQRPEQQASWDLGTGTPVFLSPHISQAWS